LDLNLPTLVKTWSKFILKFFILVIPSEYHEKVLPKKSEYFEKQNALPFEMPTSLAWVRLFSIMQPPNTLKDWSKLLGCINIRVLFNGTLSLRPSFDHVIPILSPI
jgi:hypothetical protein